MGNRSLPLLNSYPYGHMAMHDNTIACHTLIASILHTQLIFPQILLFPSQIEILQLKELKATIEYIIEYLLKFLLSYSIIVTISIYPICIGECYDTQCYELMAQ